MTSVLDLLGQGPSEAVLCSLVQIVQDLKSQRKHSEESGEQILFLFNYLFVECFYPVEICVNVCFYRHKQ